MSHVSSQEKFLTQVHTYIAGMCPLVLSIAASSPKRDANYLINAIADETDILTARIPRLPNTLAWAFLGETLT